MFSLMFFFFNDTATTEIYTLSLHDALPILGQKATTVCCSRWRVMDASTRRRRMPTRRRCSGSSKRRRANGEGDERPTTDRKSTRLNSSHANISYAVFCLKKKKKNQLNV